MEGSAIRAAYSLNPIPEYEATTMFIGFDTTNGATAAMRNTANASGVTSFRFCCLAASMTSGVTRRIAESFVEHRRGEDAEHEDEHEEARWRARARSKTRAARAARTPTRPSSP